MVFANEIAHKTVTEYEFRIRKVVVDALEGELLLQCRYLLKVDGFCVSLACKSDVKLKT